MRIGRAGQLRGITAAVVPVCACASQSNAGGNADSKARVSNEHSPDSDRDKAPLMAWSTSAQFGAVQRSSAQASATASLLCSFIAGITSRANNSVERSDSSKLRSPKAKRHSR